MKGQPCGNKKRRTRHRDAEPAQHGGEKALIKRLSESAFCKAVTPPYFARLASQFAAAIEVLAFGYIDEKADD
jgi:hypothetical protein